MNNKLDYNSLLALKAVVEQGSFIKGAAAMEVTQSAISQRIKALESIVGGPVINRGPKISLTDAGEYLLNHLDQVFDLEQKLAEKIPQLDLKQSPIRIAVNADSLATWWFKNIAGLSKDLNIRFDIISADQDQALSKMANGEVIACLCSNEDSLSGARAIKAKTMNYRMYATQAFIDKHFSNSSFNKSVAEAPAVIYDRHDKLHDRYLAAAGYNGAYPYHKVPSVEGIAQAIINGLGYGLLADEQAEALSTSSDLINIKNNFFIEVDLYWHYWRNSSGLLEKFSELFTPSK